MKQWYTLYTKANSEQQVASLLQEKGIETYLPTIKTTSKPKPFFPCYLFMNADLTELSQSVWQWTPGLRRIVSRDQKPIPVSTEIIQLIKNNLGALNMQAGDIHHHQFVPGDKVRIVNGPLKEMIAIFAGPVEPSTRVRILLSVLSQQKRVQLHVKDLELLVTNDSTTSQQKKRARRTRGRGRRINH